MQLKFEKKKKKNTFSTFSCIHILVPLYCNWIALVFRTRYSQMLVSVQETFKIHVTVTLTHMERLLFPDIHGDFACFATLLPDDLD